VCSLCPDADADGVCDAVDRCPRNARVAAWFPAFFATNTSEATARHLALVDAFVNDLGAAKNITSLTDLTDTALPTLGELLSRFEAIIIGSDWSFGAADPNALGDLLADYVDAGGLVVTTMFAHTNFSSSNGQEFLGGRWNAEGYNALNLAPQLDADLANLSMAVSAPTDPLLTELNATAFVSDLNSAEKVYIASGTLNATSPLGFVELAHWSYEGQDHPAIVVSKHRDKRVLALALTPIYNFNTTNTDFTTRDFLACSISRLVR